MWFCLVHSAQTKFQIVLTKTDVLSPIDLARSATQIQQVCLIKLPFYCNLLHLHLCQPYLRGLGQQVQQTLKKSPRLLSLILSSHSQLHKGDIDRQCLPQKQVFCISSSLVLINLHVFGMNVTSCLTWSAIPNGVHEGVHVVTSLCSNFFFKPIYSLVIPWMHHVVLAKISKDVDTIF